MSEFEELALGDIFFLQNDKNAQLKSSEYLTNGALPIVDQSASYICGYTNDLTKKYSKSLPVVIFGDHTLHTKYIDFDFAIGADGTQILRPNNEKHNTKYLYYLIQRESLLMGSEGYKRHLNILKERRVFYINEVEKQQKIASILTSVDDVIEKTQKQINKLQDLKKGTMNELLTKGIGHTEFVDSPVGKIPKRWKLKSLGEHCKFTQGVQIALDGVFREYKNGYIRYLYINDFSNNNRIKFVKDIYPTKIVTEDDLVMANTGHTAGTIFKGKYGVLSNNAFKISIDKKYLTAEYLYYYLISDEYKIEIGKLFNSAGQPHVGHGNIAKLNMRFPNLDEQQKIASILSSIDKTIAEKQRKLEHTRKLKKSLMNDLLTGKKRVTV